jgi:hypothetical protein
MRKLLTQPRVDATASVLLHLSIYLHVQRTCGNSSASSLEKDPIAHALLLVQNWTMCILFISMIHALVHATGLKYPSVSTK